MTDVAIQVALGSVSTSGGRIRPLHPDPRTAKDQRTVGLSLPVDKLEQLPFVDHAPTDGRTVFLLPSFNEQRGTWETWVPTAPGVIGRLQGGEPVLGPYYARTLVDPSRDFRCVLATFIRQHLSFPAVAAVLEKIEGDFFQFCAILEKYHMIAERRAPGVMTTLLVGSELEYLIIVVRSLYDLVQRVSKAAAALVLSLDDEQRRMISDLPDSFAKVVLHGDRLRTLDEIEQTFRLPNPLARFYTEEGPSFQVLRDLRVAIEHHGESMPMSFDLDEGMAIDPRHPPWDRFPVWDEATLRGRSRLGSLRLVFAYLVRDAIAMTERWTAAYASCVAVPHAISNDFQCYIRHPFGHHLAGLNAILVSPWERESHRL